VSGSVEVSGCRSVDNVHVGVVLCICDTGCTLAHHAAWQASIANLTCMQHPCLSALHSSFLATFASSLDSGDWRCLPVCVAASALFGCQHCCHVDIIACHTLACQLCILHSLPPLQATWIVGIGVACRFALQRRRCLGASIAAMLASLLATPIACEPDQCVFFIPCHLCKQCELWGMALLAGLHCSVGVVWAGKHCCQVGIMAQALPLLVCIALAKHCANLWCMLLIGHCCANCSCANLQLQVCLPCL
jgi:hypothetical protein